MDTGKIFSNQLTKLQGVVSVLTDPTSTCHASTTPTGLLRVTEQNTGVVREAVVDIVKGKEGFHPRSSRTSTIIYKALVNTPSHKNSKSSSITTRSPSSSNSTVTNNRRRLSSNNSVTSSLGNMSNSSVTSSHASNVHSDRNIALSRSTSHVDNSNARNTVMKNHNKSNNMIDMNSNPNNRQSRILRMTLKE